MSGPLSMSGPSERDHYPDPMPGHPTTRTVEVPPDRVEGWLSRFAERHGAPDGAVSDDGSHLLLTAPDGATATIEVPFPPLQAGTDLVQHLARPRTVGVLLVRRGGYAVGVFRGRELVSSKVGSGYVQGRTKAGGWSQQRFARRRTNQARHAYETAAEVAARLLAPRADLDAVVTGGDKTGVAQVLADPRLEPLRPLVTLRVLSVPDPRLSVLQGTPDQYLAARIELNALA